MEGTIRIAYLMQCHKNPNQINRLISRLSCDNVDFYIHVDKKSPIKDEVELKKNVYFVADCDRVDVLWGDYSQCEATLRLISCVLNSGKNYDYVWLISGQDYPIRKNSEINEFLRESNGDAFINVFSERGSEYARFKKRNEVYHFSGMMGPRLRAKILRRVWHYVTGGRTRTATLVARKSPFEKDYFGSSWWCLPFGCMHAIYQMGQKEKIRRYFSTSLNPDESMFQTIYMNLPCREGNIRDYLTYVDWSEGRNNPKILTKEDAAKLLSTEHNFLLARKIDENVDCEILDIIDASICE